MKVTDVVKVNDWTESLAKAVLAIVDDAIKVSFLEKSLLITNWSKEERKDGSATDTLDRQALR